MATNDGGFIGQDGLNAPDSPTGVSATAGDTEATISFTAPSDVGGSAITGYSVQSDNGDGTYYTSYDLASASYDNKSFDISAQAAGTNAIRMKPDGTVLFVLNFSDDTIYQYSLSTPYDITTASYDSKSFAVTSQDATPRGLEVKPDGTKLYIAGDTNNTVYEYDLSTAWDISTASYSSNSFSVNSQISSTAFGAVSFKSDGTSFYALGQNAGVYQYDLSTAWDVSSASYASKTLTTSSQDSAMLDMEFATDGTKVFVSGNTNDSVYQYNLSTAWDLSTGSFSGTSFSIAGQDDTPNGIAFSDSGTKMYMAGTTNDEVFQYTTGLNTYPTASPVTVTGLTNGTSYTFNVWAINAFGWSGPSDASGSVTPAVPRALLMGGRGSSPYNVIQYVELGTSGNFTDFGDLTASAEQAGSVSNGTRAVAIHSTDGDSNVIDYVTISSTGNATDFGDQSTNSNGVVGATSNDTRGLFHSEHNPANIDLVQYITIATTGNSASFGNLSVGTSDTSGACSSPTRALFGGGRDGGTLYNNIEYFTIASTGNGTDFGDLTASRYNLAALSSNTRGCFGGGEGTGPTFGIYNIIDYVTIASTGNATDFGDLVEFYGKYNSAGTSNKVTGIFAGGQGSGGDLDSVDKITIASTGNATDFGDLTATFEGSGATSAAHGGLS